MYKLKGYKLLEAVSTKTLKRRALSYRSNILKTDTTTHTFHSEVHARSDPQPSPQPDLHAVSLEKITIQSLIVDDDFSDSNLYFLEDDSDVCTDSDDDEVPINSINEDIKIWAKENFITTIAIDALLLILRKYGHRTLPKSYKTLFGTQKCVTVKTIDPGSYYHFGLETSLKAQLDQLPRDIDVPKTIILDFNTDGLPVSRSSGSQFWPILSKVKNIEPEMPAFVVGIYHGYAKPKSVSLFLKDFAQETAKLLEEGFVYKNEPHSIQPRAYICDAPAKSFLTGTKGIS